MMQNKISLAIIIPVYNEKRSIVKLLTSISTSKYISKINCIVVADGMSTDGTRKAVSDYAKKHDSIYLIDNEPRITPSALNLGIEFAIQKGANIYQFLGAHSEISADFVENLVTLCSANPDVGIINSSMDFLKAESIYERAIQLFTLSRLGRNWRVHYNLKEPKDGFCTGIFAVHKSVIDKIGLYDLSYIRNQDNDFVSRALDAGFRAVTFPELIYYYRTRTTIFGQFKQMFGYGFYVSMNLNRYHFKHKAPGYFYFALVFGLILKIILDIYVPTIGNIYSISYFSVIVVYLLVMIFEGLRQTVLDGAVGLFLPVLFVGSHFSYALGTFWGFVKRSQRVLKNYFGW